MKLTFLASSVIKRSRAAFTLIETLVVVSIIVLILALTGPSLLGTMQASRLSSAGDTVVGFLSEAQQMAMAQNLPVEVRFYKYTTPGSTNEAFHSMQLFKIVNDMAASSGQISESPQAVGSLSRLPDSVLIAYESTLSPLLDGDGFPDEKPGGNTYSGVDGATYNAIRFMPDGSCRKVATVTGTGVASMRYPALSSSCLTLCADIGQEVTEQTLPKNFYCIQIDPYTGKVRTYRPGES